MSWQELKLFHSVDFLLTNVMNTADNLRKLTTSNIWKLEFW